MFGCEGLICYVVVWGCCIWFITLMNFNSSVLLSSLLFYVLLLGL